MWHLNPRVDMIHPNNFLRVAPAQQKNNTHQIQTTQRPDWLAGRMIPLFLCFLTHWIRFSAFCVGTNIAPITKELTAWGIVWENPLQFSSMLVKLQKRSQQGSSEHSYQSAVAILWVCLSTLLAAVIGIIVRLELRTNRAPSWQAWAVSFSGHVSGGAPGDTQHTSMSERQLAW